MRTRGSRSRPIGFDALERRETPSAGGGGVVHAAFTHKAPTPNVMPGGIPLSGHHGQTPAPAASHHQIAPLDGVGLAFEVQRTHLSNGYEVVVNNVAGRSNQLGQFTGQMSPAIAPDGKTITGSANLYSEGGDYLTMSLSGTVVPTRGHIARFSGTFTVLGGTGKFAGSTGSGTIKGAMDPALKTTDIAFRGTIDLFVKAG